MGLADLAELPASPCLASRVETGIAIDPATLAMIEEIEEMVVAAARPRTARCRVRRDAIVLELDASSLNGLEPLTSAHILRAATEFAGRHGIDLPVYIEPYRMGSAFLREGQREGN